MKTVAIVQARMGSTRLRKSFERNLWFLNDSDIVKAP